MHHSPVVDDYYRSWHQLNPILCIVGSDQILKLLCGLVPAADIFGSPTLPDNTSILIIPPHLDELAILVVTKDGLTDQGPKDRTRGPGCMIRYTHPREERVGRRI